jgi:hypothetical protein
MYIKGHIYEKATNKRRTKPTDSRQPNITWTSAGACPEQQQPKKTSPSLTLSMNGTPCTVQTERPQRENNVPVDIHLPPAETAATTPVTIHAEMHDWPEKTATAPGLLWPVSFGGLGLPSGFCGNLDPRLNRESCDTKLNWPAARAAPATLEAATNDNSQFGPKGGSNLRPARHAASVPGGWR